MKPAPGPYRLTDSSGGTAKALDLDVTANGATGPMGETFVWAPGDVLVSNQRALTLEWETQSSGTAVVGTPPNTTVVPFACAPR